MLVPGSVVYLTQISSKGGFPSMWIQWGIPAPVDPPGGSDKGHNLSFNVLKALRCFTAYCFSLNSDTTVSKGGSRKFHRFPETNQVY